MREQSQDLENMIMDDGDMTAVNQYGGGDPPTMNGKTFTTMNLGSMQNTGNFTTHHQEEFKKKKKGKRQTHSRSKSLMQMNQQYTQPYNPQLHYRNN